MKISMLMILMILLTLTFILSAQNESKLLIEASNGQTNNNPLIRMRSYNGIELMWLHSDHPANSFVGYNAGFKNNINGGVSNTFIGSESGVNNTTGGDNTAVGYAALNKNIATAANSALGSYALLNTTAASFNTAVGYRAGANYNNGYNNVFVGANTDVDKNELFNVIAIGQGTVVTASSTARFGNSATISYGGYAGWTNISDGRFKKNVKANVPGLDFILLLKPVTYNLEVTALSRALNENQSETWDLSMKEALSEKEKVLQTGFIAQEVEAAAGKAGYDFSGIDRPKSQNDFYGLRYAEFVVPLVKAVQELNERLISENEILKNEIADLKTRFDNLSRENEINSARFSKPENMLTHNELQ